MKKAKGFKKYDIAVLLRPRQVMKVGYDVDVFSVLSGWAKDVGVRAPCPPWPTHMVQWADKQWLADQVWRAHPKFKSLREKFLLLQSDVARSWHDLLGDKPKPAPDTWAPAPSLLETFGPRMVIEAAREAVRRQLKGGVERKLFLETIHESWTGVKLPISDIKRAVTGMYQAGGRCNRWDNEAEPPALRIAHRYTLLELHHYHGSPSCIWVLADDCVTGEQYDEMGEVAEELMREEHVHA